MRAAALCLLFTACTPPPAVDERVRVSENPCRLSGTIVDSDGRIPSKLWVGIGYRGWEAPEFMLSYDGSFTLESPPGDVALWAFDHEVRRASRDLPLAPGEEVAARRRRPSRTTPPTTAALPTRPTRFARRHSARPIATRGCKSSTRAGSRSTSREFDFTPPPKLGDSVVVLSFDGESSSVELQLVDGPTQVCTELKGFLDDPCFWVPPGNQSVRARMRRGARVRGTIRGVPIDTRVACGGRDGLTDERGEFEATCPADATLEVGEMRVPLPTRIGHTLYVEIYSGRSRTDGTSPSSISIRQ